jgi:hypothetical protein
MFDSGVKSAGFLVSPARAQRLAPLEAGRDRERHRSFTPYFSGDPGNRAGVEAGGGGHGVGPHY